MAENTLRPDLKLTLYSLSKNSSPLPVDKHMSKQVILKSRTESIRILQG
jgi:hypothetical protein